MDRYLTHSRKEGAHSIALLLFGNGAFGGAFGLNGVDNAVEGGKWRVWIALHVAVRSRALAKLRQREIERKTHIQSEREQVEERHS